MSELQKILHIEAFFPSEKFSDPDILDILIDLGLEEPLIILLCSIVQDQCHCCTIVEI